MKKKIVYPRKSFYQNVSRHTGLLGAKWATEAEAAAAAGPTEIGMIRFDTIDGDVERGLFRTYEEDQKDED